ncbi:MAG: Crp/Fnr family transcriptional regulator [Cytophagales bacterium]|nr:MAG: Crp/Fnr family transcriptional regulator [Cytophagales bacterium]TAF61531.1 MAG: Crp/Fnr family transcriptional regulator [Cytophagales bacterium]
MENASLREFFSKCTYLSQNAAEAALDAWTETTLMKRSDFLIRPDQTESHLYWVLEGYFRLFFMTPDAEEICVGFGYENSFLCSFPSFVNNLPSGYYIQAISSAKLLGIKRSAFLEMLNQHADFERLWRTLLEQALVGRIERETELFIKSPEERLKKLMDRSPHIFQKIPLKYIASYLRMTPETLSRIRAKKS